MRVKYLGNSGFAIGIQQSLLLIDDISQGSFIRPEALRAFDRVTVLVSHVHSDHYDAGIFGRGAPLNDHIQYVISGDVMDQQPLPAHVSALRIDPGQAVQVNGMDIHAFESTDAGVSFDIYHPLEPQRNIRIFHAGDLNDWHWREENNPDWTAMQAHEFSRIVASIPTEPRMDLAFFPFDPRMGPGYEEGALQFIHHFRPVMTVPMHFGAMWTEPAGLAAQIEGETLLCPLSTPGTALDAELT
jgi:hypothetical protein